MRTYHITRQTEWVDKTLERESEGAINCDRC